MLHHHQYTRNYIRNAVWKICENGSATFMGADPKCIVVNALFYKFPKNRAPALSWWRMMLRNS